MNRIKVDKEIFDHVGKRISGVLIVPRWRGEAFPDNVAIPSSIRWLTYQ
jgi:hypothetical protein